MAFRNYSSKHLSPQAQGDKGLSLIEYALLLALLAIVAVPSVSYLGQETGDTFCKDGGVVSEGFNASGMHWYRIGTDATGQSCCKVCVNGNFCTCIP